MVVKIPLFILKHTVQYIQLNIELVLKRQKKSWMVHDFIIWKPIGSLQGGIANKMEENW